MLEYYSVHTHLNHFQASRRSLPSRSFLSRRIVVATFNGNPQTTAIVCYSPKNVSDVVVHVYNELASLFRLVPKQLIAGDVNVLLGRSQYDRHAYHTETNRYCKHFNDFQIGNNLCCLDTRLSKKNRQALGTLCLGKQKMDQQRA